MNEKDQRIIKEYNKRLDKYNARLDFQNRVSLKLANGQDRYEGEVKKWMDMCNRLQETNTVLHQALEAALNEIAASDILEIHEVDEKKRLLGAKLQAIKENEEYRARKPAFKAGATHDYEGNPVDGVFLDSGIYPRNATAKQIKEMKEERAAKG